MFNVRVACIQDLPAVKKIADANKKDIGFILRSIFEASIQQGELFVAYKEDFEIVGFVRWHHRRDSWNTVYEICVHQAFRKMGIAKLLLERIQSPIRLKCPEDNISNTFYEHLGFTLEHKDRGRKRVLNLWTFIS